MKSKPSPSSEVDRYIARFPADVRAILERVRATIAQAAPEASEAIKYGLPTLVLNENLVHFGAFQKHIGFYALPSGNAKFRRELSPYRIGKGSIQFPFDEPIPYALITRIVKFRVAEASRKTAARKKPR